MIPQDILKQVVGEFESIDEIDMSCWIIYNCQKFDGHDVNFNGQTGILEILDSGGLVEKSFAIKVTLEPITS